MIRTAILVLLVVTPGCTSSASNATWQTTVGIKRAAEFSGRLLASQALASVTAKRSGLSADDLRVCRDWRGHLERWQRYARPALRAAVAGAVIVLGITNAEASARQTEAKAEIAAWLGVSTDETEPALQALRERCP